MQTVMMLVGVLIGMSIHQKVKMVKEELVLQSLVFDKEYWRYKKDIKEWIRRKGYKLQKHKKPIKSYDNTFRVRQRDPWRFNKSTFKSKKFGKGITAVFGNIK